VSPKINVWGEESNPILSSAPLSSLKSTEGDETSDMHAGEGERWMMEMEQGESRTAGELCYSAIL
jgi:hypothetical protein